MLAFKASKCLNFEWCYTQLKFKPGAVEKIESNIGSPAVDLTLPAKRPIVVSFSSTVPGLNLSCV